MWSMWTDNHFLTLILAFISFLPSLTLRHSRWMLGKNWLYQHCKTFVLFVEELFYLKRQKSLRRHAPPSWFYSNFFHGISSLHKRIKLSFCYAQEGHTLITERDSFKSTKLPLISPSIVPSNVSFDHCFLGNRLLPLSPRFSLWYLESAKTRTRYHIRSFTPLSTSGGRGGGGWGGGRGCLSCAWRLKAEISGESLSGKGS